MLGGDISSQNSRVIFLFLILWCQPDMEYITWGLEELQFYSVEGRLPRQLPCGKTWWLVWLFLPPGGLYCVSLLLLRNSSECRFRECTSLLPHHSVDFSLVHPLPCRWELEGPSQEWSLTLLTLVSCTLHQLPAVPSCRILMAILPGSSPSPRTGSKKYSNVLGFQEHYEKKREKGRCLTLYMGAGFLLRIHLLCPLNFSAVLCSPGRLNLFIFLWNGVVGRRELFFIKGRAVDACLLTTCYTRECGLCQWVSSAVSSVTLPWGPSNLLTW